VKEISVAPNEPVVTPAAKDVSPPKRLDELRTRARTQAQSGERVQALNTVVEGLRIDPKDSALRSMIDSMLRDAEASVQRSKQAAENEDAAANAEEAFGRGSRKEREGLALRRAGRNDAAIRAFWMAADQFSTAAALAKEETEQARLAEEQRKKQEAERPAGRSTQPPTPTQPERKPLDTRAEQDLVTQTLHRYEAAYASLSAEDVRKVYPTAPIDQLAKELADHRSYSVNLKMDQLRFKILSETRTVVFVPCRVTYDLVAKSGQRTQFERQQTFTLEKRGNTWLIVDIQ